jgi:hypothetical protein
MGTYTLFFLDFLFGSMKDWLNFSRYHDQQMVSTGNTRIIWQVGFLKAHGSLVSNDWKTLRMQRQCPKTITLRPGAGHTGFFEQPHKDVRSLKLTYTTYDEILSLLHFLHVSEN